MTDSPDEGLTDADRITTLTKYADQLDTAAQRHARLADTLTEMHAALRKIAAHIPDLNAGGYHPSLEGDLDDPYAVVDTYPTLPVSGIARTDYGRARDDARRLAETLETIAIAHEREAVDLTTERARAHNALHAVQARTAAPTAEPDDAPLARTA